MLELQPLTLREAYEFVRQHHRHHLPPQGAMFAVGLNDGEKVVGCAIIGKPVARMLNNDYTLEVTRLTTDGTTNAASMLYGACWRAARALGYRRLITYTLRVEPGTSLRAAGWRELYSTKGGSWDTPSRPRVDKAPTDPKTLWEMRA